jgi:hypothetical protein
MREASFRLGHIPALIAFVAFYALGALTVVVFDDDVAAAVGVGLFLAYGLYGLARPHHRLDAFLYAGAMGSIVHDLLGISRLWGLIFVPLVLVELRDIDYARPLEAG